MFQLRTASILILDNFDEGYSVFRGSGEIAQLNLNIRQKKPGDWSQGRTFSIPLRVNTSIDRNIDKALRNEYFSFAVKGGNSTDKYIDTYIHNQYNRPLQ